MSWSKMLYMNVIYLFFYLGLFYSGMFDEIGTIGLFCVGIVCSLGTVCFGIPLHCGKCIDALDLESMEDIKGIRKVEFELQISSMKKQNKRSMSV